MRGQRQAKIVGGGFVAGSQLRLKRQRHAIGEDVQLLAAGELAEGIEFGRLVFLLEDARREAVVKRFQPLCRDRPGLDRRVEITRRKSTSAPSRGET